jgi:hypothetical protein
MKSKILAAGVTAAAMLAPAATMAGNTNTLTATATVQAVCNFTTTTSTLAFGSIDPTGAGAVTQTTSIGYACTSGTTPTLTMPTSGTMTSGANSLPFSLSNTDTGSAIDITGTVAQADYSVAPAGSYTGTVTYTIAP